MIGAIVRGVAGAVFDHVIGRLASLDKPRAGAVEVARVAGLVVKWLDPSERYTDAAVDRLARDAAALVGVKLAAADVKRIREAVGVIVLQRALDEFAAEAAPLAAKKWGKS